MPRLGTSLASVSVCYLFDCLAIVLLLFVLSAIGILEPVIIIEELHADDSMK